MKTVGLTQEAYDVLAQLKRAGDSFSDVVLRLTGAPWLERFTGTMDEATARGYEEAVEAGRRRADRERDERSDP